MSSADFVYDVRRALKTYADRSAPRFALLALIPSQRDGRFAWLATLEIDRRVVTVTVPMLGTATLAEVDGLHERHPPGREVVLLEPLGPDRTRWFCELRIAEGAGIRYDYALVALDQIAARQGDVEGPFAAEYVARYLVASQRK